MQCNILIQGFLILIKGIDLGNKKCKFWFWPQFVYEEKIKYGHPFSDIIHG